jgi:hypothetical protein
MMPPIGVRFTIPGFSSSDREWTGLFGAQHPPDSSRRAGIFKERMLNE